MHLPHHRTCGVPHPPVEPGGSLGDEHWRASREEWQDAWDGCWLPRHRLLLGMHLDRLELLNQQIEKLYVQMGEARKAHPGAVARRSEALGFGPDSAMPMIAEVGPTAATFSQPGTDVVWGGLLPRPAGERRQVDQ